MSRFTAQGVYSRSSLEILLPREIQSDGGGVHERSNPKNSALLYTVSFLYMRAHFMSHVYASDTLGETPSFVSLLYYSA